MTPKEAIAKAILWAFIQVKKVEALMGGLGHGFWVCKLEPREPPDPGPWEGVCSPRICPDYEDCISWATWRR